MKSFKQSSLNKATNQLVGRLEQINKLKEIANRKNYPYQISQLRIRIQEQYDFWKAKTSIDVESKLADIKKDLNFIQTQVNNSNLNKERIDVLIKKYGCI